MCDPQIAVLTLGVLYLRYIYLCLSPRGTGYSFRRGVALNFAFVLLQKE